MTLGARAATSVERHLRIAIERVGEHVADAEQVEQRRAVGVGRQRHPRPAPHRDERVPPARRQHRHEPVVPLVATERRRHGGVDVAARGSAPPARRRSPNAATSSAARACQSASTRQSSARFSSSFTTTRSGFERDDRRRGPGSSSRRPPPRPRAASQKRVIADRLDAERAQRLGRRRHQRDDSHGCAGHMRSSSCAFFASNSAALITPLSRRSASCCSCSGMFGPGAGAGAERPPGRRAQPGGSPAPSPRACGRGPPSAGRSPAARRRDGARG